MADLVDQRVRTEAALFQNRDRCHPEKPSAVKDPEAIHASIGDAVENGPIRRPRPSTRAKSPGRSIPPCRNLPLSGRSRTVKDRSRDHCSEKSSKARSACYQAERIPAEVTCEKQEVVPRRLRPPGTKINVVLLGAV